MTSSSEGKKFTIPSIEDVRKYELAQESNEPLLFTKQREISARLINEGTSDGIKVCVVDQVTTTTTPPVNTEVSMTTSSPVATAVTSTIASTYSITAHPVQRQNPVVRFIRNIPVTFDDIIPDFILGKTTCALFLR